MTLTWVGLSPKQDVTSSNEPQLVRSFQSRMGDHQGSVIDQSEVASTEPTKVVAPNDVRHLFSKLGGSKQADEGVSRAELRPITFTAEEQSAMPLPGTSNPVTVSNTTPEPEIFETRPQPSRTTSIKLKNFFQRSRSSTLEGTQSSSNPQSTQGSVGSTPIGTETAPLSPTSSYAQYISHSAEHSIYSRSTNSSSTCSKGSSTSSIAKPWHLSRTPGNYSKKLARRLSFRNIQVMFASPPKEQRASGMERSTSLNNAAIVTCDKYISIPAATGAGLKARRLSNTLPVDFDVDVVELYDEYTSGSMVPGRRGRLLGKGSTATVTLMLQKGASTDTVFAVKEFGKKGQHETEEEYVRKVKSEYTIAKSLKHPNIVESVRLCTHAGRWNHVMEYCSQGEIFSLVLKNYFGLEDHLCLFKQLLRGVAYLHSHGIAHRDIKLENLLMNSEGHLKITDFGVSEVFRGEHPGLKQDQTNSKRKGGECRLCEPGICGSLPYIAPEVIDKNGPYDPRPLDVWSCAIVLLTMIHKGNPWPAANRTHPHHHYMRYLAGWDEFIDKHPSGLITGGETPHCGPLFHELPKPAIKRLVLRMLHPNPNKRIGIQDALGDRFVKGVECCCLEDKEGMGVDARMKEGSRATAGSVEVRKAHSHLPPKAPSRLPSGILQRFDFG